MLDIKFIRDNADLVRQALANRNDKAPLDEILLLDKNRRAAIASQEELRRAQKEAARKREASDEGRDLRDRIKGVEDELRAIDCKLAELLLQWLAQLG